MIDSGVLQKIVRDCPAVVSALVAVLALLVSLAAFWGNKKRDAKFLKLLLLERRIKIRSLAMLLLCELERSMRQSANNLQNLEAALQVASDWFIAIEHHHDLGAICEGVSSVFHDKDKFIDRVVRILSLGKYCFSDLKIVIALDELGGIVREFGYYASQNVGGDYENPKPLDCVAMRSRILTMIEKKDSVRCAMDSEMTIVR